MDNGRHPASAEESAKYYEDKDEALSQWLYELVALRKFRNDVWVKVEEQVKIRDRIYDLNQEPKEEEIPDIDYYKRLVRLEKNQPARCRYKIVLTDNDIVRALSAYEKGNYCMGYIDTLHFEIVKRYLKHLSGSEYDTSEIFDTDTMGHVMENDWYLLHIGRERVIDSFNEVLDFIGSINRSV